MKVVGTKMGMVRAVKEQSWFVILAAAFVVFCFIGSLDLASAQKRPARRPTGSAKPKAPKIDYTKFSHTTHSAEQKLACDTCHKFPTKNWNEVRKGNDAFPDVLEFPEHSSCLNCHRQQFFARERPAPGICSNCHVAVTPRNTVRYLFPSVGEQFLSSPKGMGFVSEFQVAFPHDKHVEVVGLNQPRRQSSSALLITASFGFRRTRSTADEPKSCPVCHQTYKPQGDSSEEYFTKPPATLGDAFWLKKGTFKTRPLNHSACFTCHSDDSGIAPAPKDCSACHKLFTKPTTKIDFDVALPMKMGITDSLILRTWPRRDLSATFRHEGGAHPEVSCNNCHNPATMNLLQPETMRVKVTSCGGADGCHVTATTDDGGALNLEIDERKKNPQFQCTKCHLKFGSGLVPESHIAAVAAMKKK